MECASFVRYLGEDQPVYGIRLPAAKLDDACRIVADEILRVRPQGPYAFAGWCAAGVIGLEVARRLEKRSAEIAFAALFDARTVFLPPLNPYYETWVRTWMYCQKTGFFLRRVAQGGLKPIQVAWKSRADRINRAGREIRGVQAPDLIAQSIDRFRPAPWNGRVVHIWAEERPRGRFRDPAFSWRYVSPQGFKFYEVPGDHTTMLQEPAIARVAMILSRELRVARIRAKAGERRLEANLESARCGS